MRYRYYLCFAFENRHFGEEIMIVVHHLNNSRSQRILWLLEELGVDYEIKYYQRDPETMLAPPELYEVHPLGKSPVITDAGQTIAESGAIAEYIVSRYGNGKLVPFSDTPEHLRYTYWLHYAEGSAMPPLLLYLIFYPFLELRIVVQWMDLLHPKLNFTLTI